MYEEQHDRAIYEQAFNEAIAFATEGLKAERVIVSFSGNGRLHGLDAEMIWTSEPMSLTLLRDLIERQEPSIIVDAIGTNPHVTSITLSGLRSVLFVPLRARTGEVCGCYYLDNRIKNGAFSENHLKQAEAVIEGRVEPLLRQTGSCRPLTWELMTRTCWL